MKDNNSSVLKLSESMNKKKLYLDSANASTIEKEIERQLTSINKTLNNINSILNKAIYKKMVKGDSSKKFIDLSKKISSNIESSNKLANDLALKFDSDFKDYSIGILDSRISELEKKLSIILNDN